ncbi:unnamed protein product [Trifolium pratense]|uniref:Uncharacterized protein n=1 Tax=Trifolium pratense TaxID=57577 RepID=A0ACB0KZR8_TRIPR|nr:unnamed protein product [Trifolium pratense]
MSVDSNVGAFNGTSSSNSQNKGYQNDTLNPYFLHPNENPNLALVTPLLSGPNYHSWSRAMTMALRSKNKMHFINGTLPRPDDDDRDSLAWDRCNTMLLSWLNNSVSPEISQSILWLDSASEIWQELKERFYQGDVFRISDLQDEISSLKQGDSTISTYYTSLKKLWQELDNFRPIPDSHCVHNCVHGCAAIAKMKSYKESDQVIRFLKGLNEQYHVVRSQIMLMDPLPTISKVYSLLVQQERQLATPVDESKLLAVSGNNHYAGRGHSTRGRGTRGGRSYGNGGRDGNNDHKTGKFSLTAAQQKALLALLQGSTSMSSHSINHVTTNTGILCTIPLSNNSDQFILDTSATDHICFDLKYFQCLKQIPPINLKLPNGTLVNTCLAGTIMFDHQLYLTDVLYFPNFTFNLISVPKLTKNLHCSLMFNDNKCVIQESSSKRMIGVADLLNGLYILTTPKVSLGHIPNTSCINNTNKITDVHSLESHKNSDCNVWHKRFGHASNDKLIELNKNFLFVKISNSSVPCDACFFAKQKRLPFTLSSTKSASNFDLVHMDI